MKKLAEKVYQCEYCETLRKTEAGILKHEMSCTKNTDKVKQKNDFDKEVEDIRVTSTSIHEVIDRVLALWLKHGIKVTFTSYPSSFSKKVSNSHHSPSGYPQNWGSEPNIPKGYPGWQGQWAGSVEVIDVKKAGYADFSLPDLGSPWSPCGNLGIVPFIKISSGGGREVFSYSGMMFLYDFPKMHQEFIDNGEDFVVLEEDYNEGVQLYKSQYERLRKKHIEEHNSYQNICKMLNDMRSSIATMEIAKLNMAKALGDEFAKTYDVPLTKPTTIFVNDEAVMNASCATQAPEKIIHPDLEKMFSYVRSIAEKIAVYRENNPELFI